MKNSFYFIIVLTLTFASCHRKDEKFCSCLEKSKEVNALTDKIWRQTGSKADSLNLKKLLEKKSNVCAAYESTNGDELLVLTEDCK